MTNWIRNRALPIPFVAEWLVVAILSPLLGGCISSDYVRLREAPSNPLASRLDLNSRSGPKLTPRTTQLLRRYDVSPEIPFSAAALESLQTRIRNEPTPELVHACAEMAYLGATKAAAEEKDSEAIDLYGTAVAHAYWYLFDPKFDAFRNPYDPQFRESCDLYNASLEAAMRLVQRKGKLKPGSSYTVRAGKHEFNVEVVARGPWHDEDFERLEFVSDYEITGLANQHHTYGLGVPLIAVRRQHAHESADEKYYPPGLCFAATAFLRVKEPPDDLARGQPIGTRHCVLELYDPMQTTSVSLAGRTAPLETDISTPLAYLLNDPAFKENKSIATFGFFFPNQATANKGLFMIEPYDPQRIPVLMVHGLWSSPTTWMEMFNDLRAFPEIRQRYQFWFYLYPTGQPFWVSAAQLRQELAAVRHNLDPHQESVALDRMVLVGHSMGGLVSRLQVVDSGDQFWRLVSDKPFNELKADRETRESMAQNFYFSPNSSVRRIITIGTPSQGSEFANDYTRWFGRKFIRLPTMMMQLSQRVIRENPGYFRNTELLTITTSLDSLAPESPFLPALAKTPRAPWVQHHNIVGVVPKDGFVGYLSKEGDGIVTRTSAQLNDVNSQLIVPADHVSVHQHPRSILEVRRILLEHEQQFLAETSSGLEASFASQPLGPPPAPPAPPVRR